MITVFYNTLLARSCILTNDPEQAIKTLATLLPEPADREAALAIARGVFPEGKTLNPEVEERLEAIQKVLDISP